MENRQEIKQAIYQKLNYELRKTIKDVIKRQYIMLFLDWIATDNPTELLVALYEQHNVEDNEIALRYKLSKENFVGIEFTTDLEKSNSDVSKCLEYIKVILRCDLPKLKNDETFEKLKTYIFRNYKFLEEENPDVYYHMYLYVMTHVYLDSRKNLEKLKEIDINKLKALFIAKQEYWN